MSAFDDFDPDEDKIARQEMESYHAAERAERQDQGNDLPTEGLSQDSGSSEAQHRANFKVGELENASPTPNSRDSIDPSVRALKQVLKSSSPDEDIEVNVGILLKWANEQTLEIIGKKDWRGCSWLKEFGHHGKDCNKPGGCIERMNRDELRDEQRAALSSRGQ